MDQGRLILSESDLESIRMLPKNVVPVSKPSKVIERLLEKRRLKHENTLKEFKKRLKEINEDIDQHIRVESEILRLCLVRYKNAAEELLNRDIRTYNDNPIERNPKTFEQAVAQIYELADEKTRSVNAYYDALVVLEGTRSKRFKRVLRDTHETLLETYYKLPYELQTFFDGEILNLNQITVVNYYYFAELRHHLKLRIEKDVRHCMLEITDCQDKYRVALRKIRRLNSMNIPVSLKYSEFASSKIRPWIWGMQVHGFKEFCDQRNQYFGKAAEAAKRKELRETASRDQCILGENWSIQAEDIHHYLLKMAKKLVELYKVAEFKISHRFFDDLQLIADSLILESGVGLSNIIYTQSENYPHIISKIAERHSCDTEELEQLWGSITEVMKSKLSHARKFLSRSARLWDEHFQRTEEAQALILQDLKDTIEKNNKAIKAQEIKFNVAVDKLRQEPTEIKLQKSLKNVIKMLDNMKKMLHKQCDFEVNILKKYQKLIDKETDLLVTEIDLFLNLNDPHESSSMNNKWSSHHSQSSSQLSKRKSFGDLNKEHLIPQEMKVCRVQVDTAEGGILCLWQAIKEYLSGCREETSKLTDDWIETHCQKIRKRYEVKLAMHNPRYQRVKNDIFDVRLLEIQQHLEEVSNLEKKIEELVSESKNLNTISKNIQKTWIEDHKEKNNEIAKNLKQLKNSAALVSRLKRLEQVSALSLKIVDDDFEKRRSFNENAQQQIKASIVEMTENIRLFSEEGNYHPEEVKIINKKLAKIKKTLPKKFQLLAKETANSKSQAVAEILDQKNSVNHRLETALEELNHYEDTIARIQDLQRQIKRQVYDVKFRFRQMETFTECFVKLIKKEMKKETMGNFACEAPENNYFHVENGLDYGEEEEEHEDNNNNYFCGNLDDIKRALQEAVENVTVLANYLQKKKSTGPVIPIIISAKSATATGANLLEASDEGYMQILENLFEKSFQEIKDKAATFYNKESHRSIIYKSKIQPTYSDFIQEVSNIIEEYRFQCEIDWMERLQELTEHILKLLKLMQDFCVQALTKLVDCEVARFTENCLRFKENLDEDRISLDGNLLVVFERLKEETASLIDDRPLTKMEFFELFEASMVEASTTSHGRCKRVIGNYKSRINKECENTYQGIATIRDNLKFLEDDAQLKGLTNGLMEQFRENLNSLEGRLKALSIEISGENSETTSSVSVKSSWFEEMSLSKVKAFREFFEELSKEPCTKYSSLELFIKSKLQEIALERDRLVKEILNLELYV